MIICIPILTEILDYLESLTFHLLTCIMNHTLYQAYLIYQPERNPVIIETWKELPLYSTQATLDALEM